MTRCSSRPKPRRAPQRSEIWYHLGGWSDEGDTYDTQLMDFERELDQFWADLIGPDEQLRRTILAALAGLHARLEVGEGLRQRQDPGAAQGPHHESHPAAAPPRTLKTETRVSWTRTDREVCRACSMHLTASIGICCISRNLALLGVLDGMDRDTPTAEALWGIVHLLDALQDDAAEAGRWVFPGESADATAAEPAPAKRYYVEDDEGHHHGPMGDYEEAASVADADSRADHCAGGGSDRPRRRRSGGEAGACVAARTALVHVRASAWARILSIHHAMARQHGACHQGHQPWR